MGKLVDRKTGGSGKRPAGPRPSHSRELSPAGAKRPLRHSMLAKTRACHPENAMADLGPSSRPASVPRDQSLMPKLGASNQAVCHFVSLVPILTTSGFCILRS
jgi:hypothetical protein